MLAAAEGVYPYGLTRVCPSTTCRIWRTVEVSNIFSNLCDFFVSDLILPPSLYTYRHCIL